jgi:hypothetical protein
LWELNVRSYHYHYHRAQGKEKRAYVFVLGDDVFKELAVDFDVVPALLEADSIYLARLHLRGHVGRIHLFVKSPSAKSRLGAVSRRDDPVRDFSGDDAGGGEIAGRR